MLIGLFFLGNASSAWAEDFASLVFTPVDATQGLSGNQVRNIAQLPDGRMLITTEGQLNLYDGTGFTYLHYGGSQICSLSAYGGYHHAYIDAHGYIWMKNQHTLMAVDLSYERMLQRPDSLLASWGVREPLKDFFMDEGRNLWIVTGSDRLMRTDSRTLQSSVVLSQVSSLSALGSADLLLDLCVKDNRLYLFYRSGSLLCYDLSTRALSYRRALSGTLPDSYGSTSYVVPTADGFHQLCNGRGGGVMLHYSYQERAWEVVLHTSYWLNHLSVDRQGRVGKGYGASRPISGRNSSFLCSNWWMGARSRPKSAPFTMTIRADCGLALSTGACSIIILPVFASSSLAVRCFP